MLKCPKCGNQYRQGDYCINCGTKLKSEIQKTNHTGNSNSFKKFIMGAIFGLAILGLLFVGYFGLSFLLSQPQTQTLPVSPVNGPSQPSSAANSQISQLLQNASSELSLANQATIDANSAVNASQMSLALQKYSEARGHLINAQSSYNQSCSLSAGACNSTIVNYISNCGIPLLDFQLGYIALYQLGLNCTGTACGQIYLSACKSLANKTESKCNLAVNLETKCDSLPVIRSYSVYVEPLPPGVDSSYLQVINDSMAFWKTRDGVTFTSASSAQNADIDVQWVKEFGGYPLGETIFQKLVQIGLGNSLCLQKWRPFNYQTVLHIAEHEFGHAVGHNHSTDTNDIMYPTLTTKYAIDLNETQFLPDGASVFYPFCTSEAAAQYSVYISSSAPLDVYFVPTQDDFNKFSHQEQFSYYSGCNQQNVQTSTLTCNVAQGAGIILTNPTVFGMGSAAQYTIVAKES